MIDKLEDGEAVKLPGNFKPSCKLPKQKSSGLSVVGSDVVSLFPSLRNVEAARLAKYAILGSGVKFENCDAIKALRYIYVNGGYEALRTAGLGRLCPKWSGDRPDLITVGGSKTKLDSSWIDTKQEIFESDIKKIVACVMEISINGVMSTHLYTFCGKVFLQSDGGPIGLRSTACLAAVLMKLWDQTWAKLLKRENISFYDFLRYVDDNRCFLKPLCEGWRWDGQNFSYSEK